MLLEGSTTLNGNIWNVGSLIIQTILTPCSNQGKQYLVFSESSSFSHLLSLEAGRPRTGIVTAFPHHLRSWAIHRSRSSSRCRVKRSPKHPGPPVPELLTLLRMICFCSEIFQDPYLMSQMIPPRHAMKGYCDENRTHPRICGYRCS